MNIHSVLVNNYKKYKNEDLDNYNNNNIKYKNSNENINKILNESKLKNMNYNLCNRKLLLQLNLFYIYGNT